MSTVYTAYTAPLGEVENDLDWANEQIEAIEPNQAALREFDASEAGAEYLRIAGMTMWENLGGDSLPARASDED